VRLAGEMRIRTAQGRLTGWILVVIPFVMFIGMNLVNPGYGRELFQNPTGRQGVMIAASLMVVGILSIRKIVNVKI